MSRTSAKTDIRRRLCPASLRVRLALLSICSFAGTALAHHSYAMFDMSRRVVISGTVAKVEWSNPHVFIWLYVANKKGGYDLYGVENGSVSLLSRFGWKKETLKAGEKVDIECYPLRDGRPGCGFINVRRADGTVMGGDPFAPGGSDPSAFGRSAPSGTGKP